MISLKTNHLGLVVVYSGAIYVDKIKSFMGTSKIEFDYLDKRLSKMSPPIWPYMPSL